MTTVGTGLSNSVKEAWRANGRVNGVLLEHLTPGMLGAQTPGGGYTVAQHLAHITWVIKDWGRQLDEARLERLPDLYDKNAATFIAETDLTRIREVMIHTQETALEAAGAADNMADLPHPSLEAYLVHMMVHDAHHRGQILLALKTAGHLLPDEDALWGPWRGE